MKKKVMALLLASLTLLCACSQGMEESSGSEISNSSGDISSSDNTEDKVTLRFSWWGPETRHTTTIQACELYKSDHPNIDFEYEYGDWNSYWDRISTQAASNTLPDLMCQDYLYLEQWVNTGKHVNLDSYVESGALDMSDVEPSFASSGYIDGELYGVQCGVNSFTMMYNRDVAEEAGISLEPGYTWDDLMEYSRIVYEKTGVRTQIQDPTEFLSLFSIHAREMGYKVYAEDGKSFGFPVETLEEFLQKLLDIRQSGYAVDIDRARETGVYEDNMITTGEQ